MSGNLRAELFRLLPDDDTPYALAYSGGGDSLALLKALAGDPRLKGVLHVDHGLRDGSSAEAEHAGTLATRLCQPMTVLRWDPGPLRTGLQEKARRARYRLMGDWCRSKGIAHLVTAHHADDQAETVLMRVERSSGWRGAAGMAKRSYGPVWPELAGIWLLRPALNLSGEALRSDLGGMVPVEDPSNRDPSFARIRARQRLRAEPAMREELLGLAAEMASGREADRQRLERALDGHHLTHEGELTLAHGSDLAALCALLPVIGGQGGPAERSRVKRLMPELGSGKAVSMGCGALARGVDGRWVLSRDLVAIKGRRDGSLPPAATRMEITSVPQIWDGRFGFSGRGGVVNPEERGQHVGYRVLYGRDVTVRNFVQERLGALLAPRFAPKAQAAT